MFDLSRVSSNRSVIFVVLAFQKFIRGTNYMKFILCRSFVVTKACTRQSEFDGSKICALKSLSTSDLINFSSAGEYLRDFMTIAHHQR